MIIKRIEGTTRELGRSQGYAGLPVRDETINCSVNGPNTPCMVSAWEPTPEELERLKAGACVHLRVLGIMPPPVSVFVGDVPKMETDNG